MKMLSTGKQAKSEDGVVVFTGSSNFSQTRIDLSCEPVTTNLPVLLTANAQISPWCPSSFWMFSNYKPNHQLRCYMQESYNYERTLSPSQYFNNLSFPTVQK